MSRIIVPLGKGFEEIEAVAIIDVCRRAGIEVIVAGVEGMMVTGANNITLQADCLLDAVKNDPYDMIVLPGGWGGTDVLTASEVVQEMLKNQKEAGKKIGAICAAPFALNHAGVLSENYTCYPSVEEKIRLDGYTDAQKVVIDGNVITSRGPGTAMCFGLEIVRILEGEETYAMLKGGLLLDYC